MAREDPVEVNVVLLGSATFFLFLGFLIVRAVRREQIVTPISWRTWNPWFIAIANLLSFIFFIYALRFVSASQTITLSKINPLFIALFSWVILRQRPPRSTVSAAFLVVLGTVLITANEKFTFDATNEVVGSLLAILAGLGFALFSIGLERVEREHSGLSERLLFLAVVFFLSYVGIVTVAHFEGLQSAIDAEAMVILLLNGLRAAVVYALYQAAVRRIGALRVSVLVALEVPFTMFWDSAWLGRVPAARLIWGSLTILFAALTLGWDMLRAREQRENATQMSAVPR
jgi:drug/metabolite transporter (DMT)-like permease